MVRLIDLPDFERQHLLSKILQPFSTQPWVTGPPLAQRRVALITTAGLHLGDDRPFSGRTGSYRIIPGDVTGRDLFMSHASVNFDRTGFQQDVNTAFPIDRLRELANNGVIGSLSHQHYSFMGAGVDSEDLDATAREVAGLLRKDGVDAAMLVPV